MKIARFEIEGQKKYGLVEGDKLQTIRGEPWDPLSLTGEKLPLAGITLLAPVQPPDIIAIGLNYRKHAEESGMKIPPAPVIFLKATSSLIGPDADIVLPRMAPSEVDFEAELVIVIGKACHRVTEAVALRHVLGYTCGNDVSARDCQLKQDAQWARGKSFNTFCPIGPWIETEMNPDHADICLNLNGRTMQSSNTSDLIFSCSQLVSYCSQIVTLRPGTVIMTGTPGGVGFARKPPVFLKPGDIVEVAISGIGTLRNRGKAER